MKKSAAGKKIVIGVTGTYGSGKSTVARMLGRGACLIDADAIGHRLLAGSPAVRANVRALFGSTARRTLGRLVFADPANRRKLDRLLHPLILAQIRRAIAGCREGLVVLDAPLLFETGLEKDTDVVVVVAADDRKRSARLRAKGVSPARIEAITRSQMPLEKKIRLADFVIDNSGCKSQTRKHVEELRRKVWRS